MPNTYEAIATQTLASVTGTIDFTSIPQTYTDLVIVTNHAYTATDQINVRVGNGSIDTGSNYSGTNVQGNGSVVSPGRQTSSSFIYGIYGTSSNDGNNYIAQFMNYANTTTFKTMLSRGNAMGDATNMIVGMWRSTSAINAIRLYLNGGSTFKVGSTFSLYGIAAA